MIKDETASKQNYLFMKFRLNIYRSVLGTATLIIPTMFTSWLHFQAIHHHCQKIRTIVFRARENTTINIRISFKRGTIKMESLNAYHYKTLSSSLIKHARIFLSLHLRPCNVTAYLQLSLNPFQLH